MVRDGRQVWTGIKQVERDFAAIFQRSFAEAWQTVFRTLCGKTVCNATVSAEQVLIFAKAWQVEGKSFCKKGKTC